MDVSALNALDQQGYLVLDALTHVRAPVSASLATPHLFTCADGHGYWVKAQSQHGLVTELVAGRLAALVDAGPPATIIRVDKCALPADGSLAHFDGVIVGSRNYDGAVNDRDLGVLGHTTLDPRSIQPAQRARVVVFQTWIGLGDLQLLIDLRTGRVMSFDHGDCFGNTGTLTDPTPIVAALPGIDSSHGNDPALVAEAVDQIESLTDDRLLEAVSRVPVGDLWRSDASRRLQIAEWLAHRRDKLRDGMKLWA